MKESECFEIKCLISFFGMSRMYRVRNEETVEAERQCMKDQKEWRALVHM